MGLGSTVIRGSWSGRVARRTSSDARSWIPEARSCGTPTIAPGPACGSWEPDGWSWAPRNGAP